MKYLNMLLRTILFFLFTLLGVWPVPADTLEIRSILPSASYTYTERENMRVYIDQKYLGLQNRQRRVYLEKAGGSGESLYSGSVYMYRNISRDAVNIYQPVDTSTAITCVIDETGELKSTGNELPVRTGFPVIPEGDVRIGDTWKADGIDSYVTDENVTLYAPFRCTYRYQGQSVVLGRDAQIILFEYSFFDSSQYSNQLYSLRGRGSGELALFLDSEDGFFIKERIIRHFLQPNESVQRKEEGFRLTWGRGVTTAHIDALETRIARMLDKDEVEKELAVKEKADRASDKDRAASAAERADDTIEVGRTTEGIKLNLPDIHFFPDEARILPLERDRLDRLADLLIEMEGHDFLVKGHTADIGTEESQYRLSIERAQTIIDELVKRGLSADRFVYQGLGGDVPVASNETEEGRERNRRVEVIILWKTN